MKRNEKFKEMKNFSSPREDYEEDELDIELDPTTARPKKTTYTDDVGMGRTDIKIFGFVIKFFPEQKG